MHSKTAKLTTRVVTVYIVIFDGFNILDVAGPTQAFIQANDVPSNLTIEYQVSVVSKAGGLVQSNSGLCLDSSALSQISIENSTLLIAGGFGVREAIKDRELIKWLKAVACLKNNRVGSVCTGAFMLAQTGILDGKKAVTHWRSVQQLQANYPAITVECDPIYINDQGVWTSAGISAGIDLALAMITEDLGNSSALEVARELVVYLKRSGGQSQFSTLLHNQMKDKEELFSALHSWIQSNLSSDLSIDRLADKANMSARTFYRLYKKVLGTTPAKSVEKIRVESARVKLESSTSSLQSIANTCGFRSEARFRRAFISQIGTSPNEYRKRFNACTTLTS